MPILYGYVEVLCTFVGIFCFFDGHFCKSGCQGCEFGPRHGHPHDGHPVHHLGYCFFFGHHLPEIKEIPRHAWVFLLLSGVATGLSWLFYFKALQTGEVSRVAPIDKLSVVITICLSFLFLKEPVSPRVVLGALLITAGSIVMLVK